MPSAGTAHATQPVRSELVPGAEGDALALARAYRCCSGVSRCYVADLDAIAGGPPQLELLHRLQSGNGFGGPLLLDAGVHSLATLQRLAGEFTEVVVGLETLRSFSDLGVAGPSCARHLQPGPPE